jgi:hypothetical protein
MPHYVPVYFNISPFKSKREAEGAGPNGSRHSQNYSVLVAVNTSVGVVHINYTVACPGIP